jgi:hypothetical protein
MSDQDSSDQSEEPERPDKTIERFDTGASIEATVKRGTGTRDEDKIKIKGKGESAEEASQEFDKALSDVEEEYAQRLRNLKREREDTDEDEE